MRQAIANLLTRMAARVYNAEHRELIEVRDEYGICRCRIEVVGDDYARGIDATLVELPVDWGMYVDGKEW